MITGMDLKKESQRPLNITAVELSSQGHNVHLFTSHHDTTRCFEQTLSGFCHHSTLEAKTVIEGRILLSFPGYVLAQHTTLLRRVYQKPIDFVEELTTGMADMILVNSKFTSSTFARTFKQLDVLGVKSAVLYPAVSVDQFERPHSFKLNFLSINCFELKKNIDLTITAFARLNSLKGDLCSDASLTVAGVFDRRLKENTEYLEELKDIAERGVSAKAMAAHKPVIACNCVGPVETIKNGITGFLWNPTQEEFASAMAKLIVDPRKAEAMGEDARKHVERAFSTNIFVERLNQCILDVVRRRIRLSGPF